MTDTIMPIQDGWRTPAPSGCFRKRFESAGMMVSAPSWALFSS